REWKEYRIFEDIELSWEVFGNKFDIGEIEWGVIVKGRDGFSAAGILKARTSSPSPMRCRWRPRRREAFSDALRSRSMGRHGTSFPIPAVVCSSSRRLAGPATG